MKKIGFLDKNVQIQWRIESVGAAKCFEQVLIGVDMGLFEYYNVNIFVSISFSSK